jgi:hypothetical protein
MLMKLNFIYNSGLLIRKVIHSGENHVSVIQTAMRLLLGEIKRSY